MEVHLSILVKLFEEHARDGELARLDLRGEVTGILSRFEVASFLQKSLDLGLVLGDEEKPELLASVFLPGKCGSLGHIDAPPRALIE